MSDRSISSTSGTPSSGRQAAVERPESASRGESRLADRVELVEAAADLLGEPIDGRSAGVAGHRDHVTPGVDQDVQRRIRALGVESPPGLRAGQVDGQIDAGGLDHASGAWGPPHRRRPSPGRTVGSP